jgi:hypothetical protein
MRESPRPPTRRSAHQNRLQRAPRQSRAATSAAAPAAISLAERRCGGAAACRVVVVRGRPGIAGSSDEPGRHARGEAGGATP